MKTRSRTIRKLRDLRLLLANEKNWTKLTMARNAHNKEVAPESGEAISFCLIGACAKVGMYNPGSRCDDVRVALLSNVPNGCSLMNYNDSPETTHEDIIALIDRTVKSLENGPC